MSGSQTVHENAVTLTVTIEDEDVTSEWSAFVHDANVQWRDAHRHNALLHATRQSRSLSCSSAYSLVRLLTVSFVCS